MEPKQTGRHIAQKVWVQMKMQQPHLILNHTWQTNTCYVYISSVHMCALPYHNGNVLPFNVARAQIHPHFKPVLADFRSSYPCNCTSHAIPGPPKIHMGSK